MYLFYFGIHLGAQSLRSCSDTITIVMSEHFNWLTKEGLSLKFLTWVKLASHKLGHQIFLCFYYRIAWLWARTLGSDQLIFMGGGHLFRSSEVIFFWKNSSEIINFFLYFSEIIFCEVSHVLHFLDDSLFKYNTIKLVQHYINICGAIIFFYSSKSEIFFLVKIGAKIFFS